MNVMRRYWVPTRSPFIPHDADLRHAAKVIVIFVCSLLAACALLWVALR